MKIIGETKDGFILEATKDDVAGLAGMYTHEKHFEIGDTIDTTSLFRTYVSASIALEDIDRLRKSARNLINAANWVDEFRHS